MKRQNHTNRGRGSFDLMLGVFGALALFSLGLFGRGWDIHATDSSAGKTPFRLAYFPNLTHAPALIGVANNTFEKALKDYDLSTKVVNAGPEAMEALLAGDIDAAYVGPSPATNTYLKSHGDALVVVAGACSGGAALVSRAGIHIGGVADLGGHTVAVPQLGGTQDVSCRRFLAQYGLKTKDEGGTVDILPINNPDVITAFKRGQIDAAWVPEPWASRLCDEAGGKLVVDERTLWPGGRFTTTVVVVSRSFSVAHPDAVRSFVRAHAETVDWIKAHPNQAQAAANAELNRLTGKSLSPRVLAQAWERLDFTTDPDPASVYAFADAAYAAHYLKAKPTNLAGLFDPEPLALAERTR